MTAEMFHNLRKTSEDHQREWTLARIQIADRWFDCDVEKADAVLSALPYSSIPTWADVDEVMNAVRGDDRG